MNEYKSTFFKDIVDSFLKAIDEENIITDKKILSDLNSLFDAKVVPSSNDIKNIIFDNGDEA